MAVDLTEGRTLEDAEVPLLTWTYLLAGGRSNRPQPPLAGVWSSGCFVHPTHCSVVHLPLAAGNHSHLAPSSFGSILQKHWDPVPSPRAQLLSPVGPSLHVMAEYTASFLSSWCSLVLQVCSTVPSTKPGHAVDSMAPGERLTGWEAAVLSEAWTPLWEQH